uniref:TPR_REGION domain-containing protein n=1 Tax=Syphacia muris TaxID=451379 RepID=A0A0N5AG40_9BILA
MSHKQQLKTVKRTLNAGHGELPEYCDGTKAIFDYEVLKPLVDVNVEGFPDSRDQYEMIDSTRRSYPHGYGKPLELVFGKKFQLPVLETCLKTMDIDEISQFDIDASELYSFPNVSAKLRDIAKQEEGVAKGDAEQHRHHCALGGFGTGYPELDELIKEPKSLRFIIHLLNVLQIEEYEPDRWQLNCEQKRESIEILRMKGNDLYKKGDYENAALQYREALTRIDNLLLNEKPGDSEWKELDKQNIILYLNLSQCYLNMELYYEAIGAADEVLRRDPTNEKAFFRKAKAETAVWDLDEAEKNLDMLVKYNVKLKNLAEQEKMKIAKLKEQRNSEQKNICKNMFNLISRH